MKAKRDWIVFITIGYLKYSTAASPVEDGLIEFGRGWYGVVVMRSCRRPHVRKEAYMPPTQIMRESMLP